jgi:hypothetical protein
MLLPIIIPAKNIMNFKQGLCSELTESLQAIGVDKDRIQQELEEMGNSVIAKTASRQILGSMNDFANILEAMMESGMPLQNIKDFIDLLHV